MGRRLAGGLALTLALLAAGSAGAQAPAGDAVGEKVVAQRAELAAWCLERKLIDESAAQLRMASLMGGSPAVEEAWLKLAAQVPPVTLGVVATLDGATELRGTITSHAYLFDRPEGRELLVLDNVRRLSAVDARDGGIAFLVEREDGSVTGRLSGEPLEIDSTLGRVSVPFFRLRALEVQGAGEPAGLYALLGVMDYYATAPGAPAAQSLAASLLAETRDRLAKDPGKYPSMRATAPIVMDRVTRTNGEVLYGKVTDPDKKKHGKWLNFEPFDFENHEFKGILWEQVRKVDTAAVPPEKVNHERKLLLLDNLRQARGNPPDLTGRALDAWKKKTQFGPEVYVRVLEMWGRLRFNFAPDDPVEPPRSTKPKISSAEREGVAEVVEWAIEWAGTRCPACGGRGTATCSVCKGKGKTEDGNDCPQCKGQRYVECKRCAGSGARRADEPLPATMPAPGREKLTQGVAPAVVDEYKAKLAGLNTLQTALLIRRSEQDLDETLPDAARKHVRAAAVIDPVSADLLAAWVKFAERAPGVACTVSATLEDGTNLKGQCSLRPLVLRHAKGVLVVTASEVKAIEMLEPKDGAPRARITTAEGTFEGTLTSPPIELRTNLGALALPLLKTRTLEIHVE